MALDLSALTAEVTRQGTVDNSASALILGLAAKFEAVKGDPAAIQALVDAARLNNDKLQDAVTANTVAATEPPAPPA